MPLPGMAGPDLPFEVDMSLLPIRLCKNFTHPHNLSNAVILTTWNSPTSYKTTTEMVLKVRLLASFDAMSIEKRKLDGFAST